MSLLDTTDIFDPFEEPAKDRVLSPREVRDQDTEIEEAVDDVSTDVIDEEEPRMESRIRVIEPLLQPRAAHRRKFLKVMRELQDRDAEDNESRESSIWLLTRKSDVRDMWEDGLFRDEAYVKKDFALHRCRRGNVFSSFIQEKKHCVICLESFGHDENHHTGWCSEHFACDACQVEFTRHSIADGKLQIGCAVGSKCSFVASNEVILARVPYEVFDQLVSNRLAAQFDFECLDCKGTTFRLCDFDLRIANCDKFLCKTCNAKYCLFCREPLVEDVAPSLFSALLKTKPKQHVCSTEDARKLAQYVLSESNQVRTCPHCFRFTHRYEGCPNMVCYSGCNRPFCWDCLAPENHSNAICRQKLYPPTPARTAARGATRYMSYAKRMTFKSFYNAGYILGTPIRLFVDYRESRIRRRFELQRRILQHGIDVYFVMDGVANAADDHEDDEEALELVHAFVGRTNYQGRWVQDRCFLSFDCFGKAGVLVRLHPHGPNDNACDLSYHRPYSIRVVISDGRTENIVEEVRRACRREVAKFGYQSLI